MGCLFIYEKKFERAEEIFYELLSLKFMEAEVYKKLGEVQYKRGKSEEAIVSLFKACQLDPADPDP